MDLIPLHYGFIPGTTTSKRVSKPRFGAYLRNRRQGRLPP